MKNRTLFQAARWLLFSALVVGLAFGCSSSDNDSRVREGVFVDSPVAGLNYETPTQSGVTDDDGRFFYEDGENVQFYLGGLRLGQAPAGPRLSPLDLVPDAEGPEHPAVTNMARLLLTLDTDCDPENGIRITERIRELFEPESIDFHIDPDAFSQMPAILTLLTALNDSGEFACDPVALWPPAAAREHLRRTLGLEAPQYTLTVTVEGEGTVDVEPPETTYAEGAKITLTARPAEGWTFAGWRGDLTGDAAVRPLTMTADQAVTARFQAVAPDQFQLRVSTEGQGTVLLNPAGGAYDAGTPVTLTAVPADGWGFAEWTGALTGGSDVETLTMGADQDVTARFVVLEKPDRFALALSTEGQGAIMADPASEDGFYAAGASVTVSALPADGWTFAGWEGAAEGDQTPLSVTMDASKTLTARFTEILEPALEYTLTLSVNGGGNVTASPDAEQYADGDDVTLTATPNAGWAFSGWSGDLSGTDPEEILTMDGDKAVTATFYVPASPPSPTPTPTPQPTQYSLTVTVEGQGDVSPDGGAYDENSPVSLTATPADGWQFDGWSGDIGDAEATANPLTLTMDANRTVTAAFSEIPPETFDLTVNTTGNGAVALDPMGGAYTDGTEVTLTATPDEGWVFDGWTGDLTGTDTPATLTMDANRTVTATFTELAMTLSGQVTAKGLPVIGAEIKVGTKSAQTDAQGNYTIALALGDRINTDDTMPGGPVFPVTATEDDHATAYVKVPYVSGNAAYVFNIPMLPVTHMLGDDDDVTNRVDIEKDGEKIGELTIPADALPAGVTEIHGTVTYLDPTTGDIDAFPGGDFLAVREGDPDGFEILESYGLMEFDLTDQNGAPITDLPGDATVCMKIPGTLGVTAGQTIPLWWYDPDAGLWREDGAGTVEERVDGSFWVCGNVSHFTWWNYDEPIETHACFKFTFVKEADATPVTGLNWYAEGVSYGGTSPARPCDCDGDDPAPCPAAAISSFTVMRNSQIRVYAVINNGARYYLKDDGDGTFSLTTDIAAATIFNAPNVQGSCMFGENVENCEFLDGPNGDGILPLGGINYAPDILSFEISDPDGNGQVDAGETVTLTVQATDAEGEAITPDWTKDCPDADLTNETQTGGTFTADFTAPPNLAICTVTFSATDERGNRSQASKTIWVFGEPAYGRISGRVFGPDGTPADQVPVRLSREADPGGNWDAYDAVFYTRPDGTYQFDEVPCDQPFGASFGFNGIIAASVDVNGTVWTLENAVNYSCEAFNNDDCLYDLYFPTLWGTLQGNVIGEALTEVTFVGGSAGGDTGNEGGGGRMTAVVPVTGGAYGPIPVPVGTVSVVDSAPDSWEWTQFPVLTDGQAVTADIGSGAMGSINGTVYDDVGNPVAGVDVVIDSGWSSEQTVTTNAGGNFSFAGVRTGIHFLYAQSTPISNTWGGTTLFTQNQTPAPVAEINGTGVTINVSLYEYDGTPMPGTEISLYLGENRVATTDSGGQCVFTGLGTGRAWISVWIQDGTDRSRGISMSLPVGESGSTINVDIQLPSPPSDCAGFLTQ